MSIRSSAVRVIVTIDSDVAKWLSDEAWKRDREKSWMIQEALRRWRHRLERERLKRVKARCQRVAGS
jgi:predicted transcriptional regulator